MQALGSQSCALNRMDIWSDGGSNDMAGHSLPGLRQHWTESEKCLCEWREPRRPLVRARLSPAARSVALVLAQLSWRFFLRK